MEDFILEGPSVPPEVCDNVIEFFSTCQFFEKSEGIVFDAETGRQKVDRETKHSIDMTCSGIAKDSRMTEYFLHLGNSLNDYYDKFIFARQPSVICTEYNIQWYPPGGGFKKWHYESGSSAKLRSRHVAWQTFLTDNPDGGTEFLYQKRYISAEKGKTIVWPAGWTHTHRGVVDPISEKMVITGWIIFDG